MAKVAAIDIEGQQRTHDGAVELGLDVLSDEIAQGIVFHVRHAGLEARATAPAQLVHDWRGLERFDPKA